MSNNGTADTKTEDIWLKRARHAFESSTSYVDNNYRRKWNDDLALFNSEHPPGSKYHKGAYKYRSRIMRPKTRMAVRAHEAATANAFFQNPDVTQIDPQNPLDPMQKASAEINQALLQHHLTKTIPWFLVCIGARQDADKIGVCISKQTWCYEERDAGKDATGQERVEVVKDHPDCRLLPTENLRIHPQSDWVRPIESSPYLIELIPMYVMDVKANMEEANPKTGMPKWKKLDDKALQAARRQTYDSTRKKREGDRQGLETTQTNAGELSDFDIVWVHENHMRIDGKDQVYFTLGTEHMLTDVMPIEELYFTGDRPYVMGYVVLETHKNYPTGTVGLGRNIQSELNEVVNQRLDNVKLVLNKRYKIKRGSNVDTAALVKNVPGGGIFMDSVDDVVEMEFNDVTGSSYQEQDRLNVDYDDITGSFSSGTVQTNRQLNETVGGLNLLKSSINDIKDYGVRLFVETWAEPVLRQLIKLIQFYETDDTVLALAGEKAQLWQKYGISMVTDELLNSEFTLTVNVGIDATDPIARLNKFLVAIREIVNMMANPLPNMDVREISKEIFSRIGLKGIERFFPENQQGDPQMQAVIQQLQQALQQAQAEIQQLKAKTQVEMAKIQADMVTSDRDREAKLQIENQKLEIDRTEQKLKEAQTVVESLSKEHDRNVKLQIEQSKVSNRDAETTSDEERATAVADIKLAINEAVAPLIEKFDDIEDEIEEIRKNQTTRVFTAKRQPDGSLVGAVQTQ